MTNTYDEIRCCETCAYFIPNHIPGERDCMHPSPRGCVAPEYMEWIEDPVPGHALDFIRKQQIQIKKVEAELETLRDSKGGNR